MTVKVKAYAKINLMLDIVNRRNDGYHDLFMIMQSVGIYDTVTVSTNNSGITEISCSEKDIPLDGRNIAYKAADAFFNYTKIKNCGLIIDIQKRIPHAAGLAGGSADGAAVIVALNKICNANLSVDELCSIGASIGADVPFCIAGGTLLSQGIGEVLSKVKPLKSCFIVLAKPDFSVNTGHAFKQYDLYGKIHTPRKFEMLCAVQNRNLNEICEYMENVFEQFIEVPNRIEIKQIMRDNNALGVCMSGSGPTVFGIFDNRKNAEFACEQLIDYAKDVYLCKPVTSGCKIIE